MKRHAQKIDQKIDRKASFLHYYHPETSIWQVEIKRITVCQLVIHQNTSKRWKNISSASLFQLQNCDVHSNWDAGRMVKIRCCFIRDFFRGLFFKNTISHIFNILALPLLIIHQNTSIRLMRTYRWSLFCQFNHLRLRRIATIVICKCLQVRWIK